MIVGGFAPDNREGEIVEKTRNPVGWGYTEDAIKADELAPILDVMAPLLGGAPKAARPGPGAADITLAGEAIDPPESLSGFVSNDHHARLLRAIGRSFRDLATLRAGTPLAAPAAVATPICWMNEIDEVTKAPMATASRIAAAVTTAPVRSSPRATASRSVRALPRASLMRPSRKTP